GNAAQRTDPDRGRLAGAVERVAQRARPPDRGAVATARPARRLHRLRLPVDHRMPAAQSRRPAWRRRPGCAAAPRARASGGALGGPGFGPRTRQAGAGLQAQRFEPGVALGFGVGGRLGPVLSFGGGPADIEQLGLFGGAFALVTIE